MEDKPFVKELKNLVQLDFDAVQAYEQAIGSIEEEPIRNTLMSFKTDHERHINDLSELLQQFNENPPERSRDVKGFILEGMTAVMGAAGTKSALTAMKANENLINQMYSDALEKEMPTEVNEVLRRNYEDERRHLAFIERALDQELWKNPERASEEMRRMASPEAGGEAHV